MTTPGELVHTKCHHCGDDCPSDPIKWQDHVFCCNGCQMVYILLAENGMEAYYSYETTPGINQKAASTKAFDFLDDPEIENQLLSFREGSLARITLQLPQIHCSSCLWLLEHINQLDPGIISSRVNFLAKEAVIQYREDKTTLRSVVELLTKIGYEPQLNFDRLGNQVSKNTYNKRLLYQLGLAGFSFGNIMLLSFPEYLGFHQASFKFYVGYINLVLAIPVLLYSGIDYLKSAWKGIKYQHLNIDVPVALGMLTLFLRSAYEIMSKTGEGYLDSFAGFIFFLLIGKWFQSFTYQSLDFDRNYTSYFPISATVKKGKEWITKALDKVEPGDQLLIKNQELIPADAMLQSGKARVDYSFVTGESDLISKGKGEIILAGGKQMGESIEVLVTKKVDQSYLTQLWNEDTFKAQEESSASRLINGISKYFTFIVLIIALATMLYWLSVNPAIAFNTFTAVLIVACPCALALAIPFTYGNILRLLSANGLYLRNIQTIENIQDVDHIIFDKTGTVTDSQSIKVKYYGQDLSSEQKSILRSACTHSGHPLSQAIAKKLSDNPLLEIDNYTDYVGSGFEAQVGSTRIRVGSSSYIFGTDHKERERGVFIEWNGQYIGHYTFTHALRKNIEQIIRGLQDRFSLAVLSGDTDSEKNRMKEIFGKDAEILFNQSPKQKLSYIQSLQAEGNHVMMIGDGLNDAGALKQSQVGLVITDDSNNFSPACDGIVSASVFPELLTYISFLKRAKWIIYGAFILAFMYNSIGLYFAITGQLSPVIAAILMPLSSITVIFYGILTSYFTYRFTVAKQNKK